MRKLGMIAGMLALTGAFWLAGCGGGDDTGNGMEPEESAAEQSGSMDEGMESEPMEGESMEMEEESMEGESMESEEDTGSGQ
ncbi:hypothetical protein [Halorhodospira neutriphila]|uniref:Lipoprotein n=1 Tax=Halorhodospira neutriphila TaxID=168379 RepID=A0ABS1E676_9GAMM|nr:hypothetical protein [Halorhodospira neutriphila]MBK1725799.1 hypothetical protein [Halorhodospira neutriphila]